MWGGQYDEGTLISCNRWIVGGSVVECREILAFRGRTDHAILVRRIESKREKAELDVLLDVGGRRSTPRQTGEACWEAKIGGTHLPWQAPVGVAAEGSALSGQIRLEPGVHVDLVLELGVRGLPGEPVEALRSFERNRAACGPAGIFTEEYDVHQRQLRGNFPQAFVHALLLEASTKLAGPQR